MNDKLPAKTDKVALPTIEDLYDDKTMVQAQSKLALLLNCPPKNEWLQEHPIIKYRKYDEKGKFIEEVPHKYLPIERVEYLLTMLFRKWYVEVQNVKLIANSVVVTVRLFYQDPVTMTMYHQDGVGAAPLQTGKGKGAVEFNDLLTTSVQTGAPAAKSFAIKDAADHIGKIFGKDLNRENEIGYGFLAETPEADMSNFSAE